MTNDEWHIHTLAMFHPSFVIRHLISRNLSTAAPCIQFAALQLGPFPLK
jgi:hypothetical protein